MDEVVLLSLLCVADEVCESELELHFIELHLAIILFVIENEKWHCVFHINNVLSKKCTKL